jgi:putative transposase
LAAKYRTKIFDAEALNRFKTIFDKVCREFEAQLVQMNGESTMFT